MYFPAFRRPMALPSLEASAGWTSSRSSGLDSCECAANSCVRTTSAELIRFTARLAEGVAAFAFVPVPAASEACATEVALQADASDEGNTAAVPWPTAANRESVAAVPELTTAAAAALVAWRALVDGWTMTEGCAVMAGGELGAAVPPPTLSAGGDEADGVVAEDALELPPPKPGDGEATTTCGEDIFCCTTVDPCVLIYPTNAITS